MHKYLYFLFKLGTYKGTYKKLDTLSSAFYSFDFETQ